MKYVIEFDLPDNDTVLNNIKTAWVGWNVWGYSGITHAKPKQPERKTGRWIYGEDNLRSGVDGWFCSECEHFEAWDYSADMKSAELNLPNFCPNCGADMRGEEK